MPQQYKIDKVAEIEERVEASAGLYVMSYNGLTVKQAQELRHALREAGAEMKVYKNNLVRLALKNQEQVKGGISEGKAITAEDAKAMADLPTKDQLLGQIAGLINGFARDIAVCVNGVSSGLARTVQQISEQKAA